VLSNPELRARYDKHGSAGLDVEFVDPSVIFGMLFGSELFEPIVGEFLIAAATSRGRELSEKEVTLMQVWRGVEMVLVGWWLGRVLGWGLLRPGVLAWAVAGCTGEHA
jgi:hypothetical protein